jgi:hypothetical protein
MTRPFVKSIRSNLQGGSATYLGAKTLLVGPNAIGKSAIIRSIELATTGRASDIAGRDTLALDAELASLITSGLDTGECIADFSEGGEAVWTLIKGKRSKRIGPTAAFPLRDIQKAILGSAETARKFFLSQVSGLTWKNFLAEIPDQFHKRLQPFADDARTANAITLALEAARKDVREKRAEAKAQREVAGKTTQGLAPPASDEEIARAKEAVANAGIFERTSQARQKIGQIDAQILTLEEVIATFGERVSTMNAALAVMEKGVEIAPIVEHLLAVLEHVVEKGVGICPTCGELRDPAVFATRLATAKGKVSGAIEAGKKYREAQSALREANVTLDLTRHDLDNLRIDRETLRQIAGVTEIDAPPAGDYATLIANAAAWKTARAAEASAAAATAAEATSSQLAGLIEQALARLLARALQEFVDRVQSYLPPGMHFGAELRDGDREVFRIGLRTEKSLRTALSGAEWSTVMAAVALACSPKSGAVIVVPEDRDFDPDTLEAVMRGFGSFDGQVILAGTKEPRHPVEGWNVVKVEKIVLPEPSTSYCAECRAEIMIGMCPHNVEAAPPPPKKDVLRALFPPVEEKKEPPTDIFASEKP